VSNVVVGGGRAAQGLRERGGREAKKRKVGKKFDVVCGWGRGGRRTHDLQSVRLTNEKGGKSLSRGLEG